MSSDLFRQRDLGRIFNIEKLAECLEGVVIIDLSGIADTSYVQINNSRNRDKLADKVRQGDIIPINADALSDFSSHHALIHLKLGLDNILPVIPTITNVRGQRVSSMNYDARVIPSTWVHKRSGLGFSHGGKGINIISSSQVNSAAIKDISEFVQPFILPPANAQGERYVTDTRTIIVGGKVVAGISRKASKPLSADILSGKSLPTSEYFPTATHPGTITTPDLKYWDRIVNASETVAAYLKSRIPNYKNRLHSPLSQIGFASLDFLIDANGTPLLVDFDLQPMIRSQIVEPVGTALANYAMNLSLQGGKERLIVVLGEPDRDLKQQVIQTLQNTRFPTDKIISQDIE